MAKVRIRKYLPKIKFYRVINRKKNVEIMEFIFGSTEKNTDPLVSQLLNRMSSELGQCVDWYALFGTCVYKYGISDV